MIHRALAADLGAGSGRVLLGTLEGGRLTVEEVHRFGNEPVLVHGRYHWDILALFREILVGLRAGVAVSGDHVPATVGIDTWGVDYGLLDSQGRLLQNPVCYRDPRTNGLVGESERLCGEGTLFSLTGLPDLFFNTSVQLLAVNAQEPELSRLAHRLLFTPDLLNYFLTGVARAERTIASTSQLLEAGPRGRWSEEVLRLLGLEPWLPKLPELVEPGTVLGSVTTQVAESGLPAGLKVVAVAGHDTESSLLAMPSQTEGAVFLNLGSWALLGRETGSPVLDARFREAGFSNEAAYGGKVCLLRNIMGLWLAQECKRTWERSSPLDWPQLYSEAADAPAFQCWIDPDHPSFVTPGDLPRRIAEYCTATGQSVPTTRGAVLRCILESLAFRFRETVDSLESLTEQALGTIHVMGGGSRSVLLCQFTADACGREVEAGPEEGSGTGNLLAQFLAVGVLGSVDEARSVVKASFGTRLHRPTNSAAWAEAYPRFRATVGA